MLKEFGPAFLLLQMECRILRRRKFMRVTDTSGWADFETNEDPSRLEVVFRFASRLTYQEAGDLGTFLLG